MCLAPLLSVSTSLSIYSLSLASNNEVSLSVINYKTARHLRLSEVLGPTHRSTIKASGLSILLVIRRSTVLLVYSKRTKGPAYLRY